MAESVLRVAEDGDFGHAALAMAESVEGCVGLQIAYVDRTGRGHRTASALFDPSVTRDYNTRFATAKTNPVMRALPRIPRNALTPLEAVIDLEEVRRTRYHDELLAQCGPVRISVMSVPGRFGTVTLGLAQDVRARHGRALDLDWVGVQIGMAFDLRLGAAMPGRNAFLIDAAGCALGMSAREVEAASLGTLQSSGPLRPVRPASVAMAAEFDAVVRGAVAGQAGSLVLPAEDGPCRVTVRPGPRMGLVHVAWVDVGRMQAPDWSVASLGAVHGLTPREATVVLRLIEGKPIPEIASGLGLSERSVRTYLSHVFLKTGTGGQAQFLSLILGPGA